MNTFFSIFAWNSFATRRPAGAASLARWRRAGRLLGMVLPLLVGGAELTLAQEAHLGASAPLCFAATGRGPQGTGLRLSGSLSGWHPAYLHTAPADLLLADAVGALQPGETLTATRPACAGQPARTIQVTAPATGGTGQFVADVAPAAAGPAPLALALGDLDGDAELDAVTLHASETGFRLRVGQGQGGGRFGAAGQELSLPSRPTAVVLADLNHDTYLDAVVTLGRAGDVLVLSGRGNATFGPATTLHVGAVLIRGLATADVNGDGRTDLLVAAFDPQAAAANRLAVYLGTGRGLARRPAQRLALPELAQGLHLGDLDHDGDLDLVAAGPAAVRVHFNNGRGGFAASRQYPFAVGAGTQVALADADQDGDLDLLLAERTKSEVAVLLNSGHGTFGPGAPAVPVPDDVRALRVADVNGDGQPDLVLSYGTAAAGGVAVCPGLGGGAFAATGPVLDLPTAPAALALADLDHDGTLDLLLTAPTASGLAAAYNPAALPAGAVADALPVPTAAVVLLATQSARTR